MKALSLFSILILFFTQELSAQIREVKENPTGISRRLQHEIDMTKDPVLGYVPKSELVKAYQVRKRMVAEKTAEGERGLLEWTERGPYKDVVGISNGNTRAGNAITSGRVRAMWFDLNDPTGNTVWVGGVDGGLWKTTNINARPTVWTPINDFFGNLSIGSICQDPTNPAIMYFGTGEKSYNADAVRGSGLWMSTDNGVNWTPMAGTANYYNVSKMLCDAQGNLYVGCISSSSQGLKRYTKATKSWSDITPAGLDSRIPDFDISSTGRFHLVCGYFTATGTGYRYTDNPSTVDANTWTAAITPPPTSYNVALASNGNTLYALPSSNTWQVNTIYKSVDGGLNWAPTGSTPGFTSGQAWFCMAVAIDPNNPNNVIVGSLDCYRSTNGGTTWSKVSNWVGTTGQYVHADQQTIIWRPDNRILVASDGGIHLSPDGGTTFTDRNEGLRIKQFYSVAIHPTAKDYLLGGTQDNGTHSMNQPGLASSTEVTGGDGAFVHIDQTNGNYQFAAYVYNQYRRSTNGGFSWSTVNYSSSIGRFINPTDYDDNNDIMYCAGGNDQFVVWSNPAVSNVFASKTVSLGGGKVSTVKVSPFSNGTVFLGSQTSSASGVLVKVTNASAEATAKSIGNGMFIPNGYVSSIEFGTNENTIITSYSNYGIQNVWVTFDGGTSWTSIDGNLPNMPVRWAMFLPGDDTKAIIATETGIWQTDLIKGASTIWSPETTFPNVRTDMLQFRASDGMLAAATHGRGMFTAFLNTTAVCGNASSLAAADITTNSALLKWNGVSGTVNYLVEYKKSNEASWTVLSASTTGTQIQLNNLTEGSNYDWRVKATCTNQATGEYVQAQFTTLITVLACDAPSSLSVTDVSQAAATLLWGSVPNAVSYNVEYRAVNAANWITVGNAITSTSFTLTGLNTGTEYMWQVRTNCLSGTSSYSINQFTTVAGSNTCQSLYDVTSNNVIGGAAAIPFNTDVTGLINVVGDRDYFKFVITSAGSATITLTNLITNYDIYLYNSTGTSLLKKSTQNNAANESITHTFTPGTYYVLVRGKSNSNWHATACYALRVQLGTASEIEIETDETPKAELALNVFPNPVSEYLHIYVIGTIESGKIDVTDATGKQLFTKSTEEMLTSLDVSALNKGIYFVRLIDEQGKVHAIQKFIKAE